MNVWFLMGSLLLALSSYPIWRFVEITNKERVENARYEVREVYDQTETSLNGHTIKLKDQIPQGQYDEHDRREAPVKIIIDGKDYSINTVVTIRPKFNDSNRYFGWVSIKHLTERKTGKQLVAVVQKIGDLSYDELTIQSVLNFRILFLEDDGKVSEERFSYSERNNPAYRHALLGLLEPIVVQYMPNLLVPVLIPGVSTPTGLVLVWIGFRKRKRGK